MHRVLDDADAAASKFARRSGIQRAGIGHREATHDAEIGPGHAGRGKRCRVEAGAGNRHVGFAVLQRGQDLGIGPDFHRAGKARLLACGNGDLHRNAGGRSGAG